MSVERKPRPVGRGSQQYSSGGNQSQTPAAGNYENRRNASACFANPNRREDWHADFTGCLVSEGLADGQKLWVNVYRRRDRKGREYLSVVLKPAQKGGK